jgi:hypothetical protein
MTVVLEDEIWTDPSDGYTIRVVRFPYNAVPEGGGLLMEFSFHTGKLWCEIPGQDDRGTRADKVHIGPLVRTHTQFPALEASTPRFEPRYHRNPVTALNVKRTMKVSHTLEIGPSQYARDSLTINLF